MQPNIKNDEYFLQLLIENKIQIHNECEVYNPNTKHYIGLTTNTKKYSMVAYYDGESIHYILKHRLIWIYHNGAIPKGMVINHIDGNKQNNVLSNLEVVTYKQNRRHAINTRLMSIPNVLCNIVKKYGSINIATRMNNKVSLEQAKEIKEKTKTYYRGIDSKVAKEYGVSRRIVSNIRRNVSWNID